MRYMIIVKANRDSEAGVMPSNEVIEAMGEFNEQLINSGVLVSGEGLMDSGKGARVKFQNGRFIVTDGPFSEAKELIAGFWIVDVKSKDEVIDWVKKIPFEEGEEIEVRKVFEASDWVEAGGDPAVVEQEQIWREQLGNR
jgi:hypothetical protein